MGFAFEETTDDGKTWTTVCIFTGDRKVEAMRFPGEHGGLVPIDSSDTPGVPSFQRKKDAKRYAAKCCVEWLMRHDYMPKDGSTATLAKTIPKPFRIPTLGATPTDLAGENGGAAITDTITSHNHGTPNSSDAVAEPPLDPPATEARAPRGRNGQWKDSSPDDESSDDEVPATQRVRELCDRLTINQPQYIISPAKNMGQNFFDGYVNFNADAPHFEEGLGRVRGSYSKKSTKERIAEEVLKALLEIEAGRMASYAKVAGEDNAQD